ncbi:protocatechuate 3,4-dioxygenase subunit alpha [Antrihabitans sp. YC3-6]|uniref:Protocatechuate 3,4-dioxygenase subunit alpha n=1 Tax=Antrihabitans stalagmiti TaxID=2799499 RepID=A0A934U1E5_9NOCA|nr:protocatechuate 3,4-dioxygenase subunit alpha [Antrihabitans stalagmiti]MBJ8338057.1 protocatechuate 3,4-dioxygenase subunit alpha [Antrihabitans stalagmiti]
MNATPGQTIGPFFGYALPYERGHELVSPADPAAIQLYGTVFDGDGTPVPDALIEIRQADADGVVPTVPGSLRRDGRFTGWGRAAVDAAGDYSFSTVEPGPTSAGQAPFFAVVVFARGLLDRLFTRVYVPGHDDPLAADPLLAGLDDERRSGLIATRTDDGNLRFDIHLQGPKETVFLTFSGHEH